MNTQNRQRAEKQQVEEEAKRAERDTLFQPVRDRIQITYQNVSNLDDPLSQSLARVRASHPELLIR